METVRDGMDAGLASLGMIQAFVILALILAVMAGLYFLVGRPNRLDMEALQRLAGKRGWTIQRKMASGGRGYRIEVRPTEGSGWSCEVTRYQNIGRGGYVQKTEFSDAAAGRLDGMTVIGPAIREKDAEAAAVMFDESKGALGQTLLSAMLGDAAESVGDLQLVREAGIPGATVFATSDAPVARIVAAYGPLLERWLLTHRDEREFPILIASRDGLRIRLRTDADSADSLEAFLGHALATRGALG